MYRFVAINMHSSIGLAWLMLVVLVMNQCMIMTKAVPISIDERQSTFESTFGSTYESMQLNEMKQRISMMRLNEHHHILSSIPIDPDQNRNVSELITSKGYICEDHTIQTDDGYVLSLQRIPYPRIISSGPPSRYPVLLQHGFLDASSTWVINSAAESLGFILADAGFDVWLGNSRGNAYCQTNVNYSNSTDQFWEFSWDQLAAYDLPAKINYILKTTNRTTLSYIGHSEGTMIGFARFSTDVKLASSVDLFIALAPVAYLGNVGAILKDSADIPPAIVHAIFGKQGFLQPWTELAAPLPSLCADDPRLCEDFICLLAGCESKSSINSTRLPVILSHFPSGSSVQNLLHYRQSVRSDAFQMYDYGTLGNKQHYGSSTAPLYSASTMSTKMALIYGSHDKMADPTDVKRLLNDLPSNLIVYTEEIANYGHGDFVWASDAKDKVYPQVTALLKQYSNA